LRRDVCAAKEEVHDALQESMTFKQSAATLELELDGARQTELSLNQQVCLFERLLKECIQ